MTSHREPASLLDDGPPADEQHPINNIEERKPSTPAFQRQQDLHHNDNAQEENIVQRSAVSRVKFAPEPEQFRGAAVESMQEKETSTAKEPLHKPGVEKVEQVDPSGPSMLSATRSRPLFHQSSEDGQEYSWDAMLSKTEEDTSPEAEAERMELIKNVFTYELISEYHILMF